jgi:hypothetical protein
MADRPSPSLLTELETAQAEVARIERAIAQGPCREYGHDWKFEGGKNAGCGDGCGCSAPVHVCRKCGDCDYGDNAEADAVRSDCEIRSGR